MSFAFLLFLLLGWVNRRDRRHLTVLIITSILTILLFAPPQAKALGLLEEIQVVLTTINSTIGRWLSNIRTVQDDIRQAQQGTVWSQEKIQQARDWATNWVNRYEVPMRQLFFYRPGSATLPHAQALEQVLINGNSATLPTLLGRYQQLYGPVPTAAQMKPQDRDMTDMDDALAQDTLEQLKRGDQVNQTIRATGDVLGQMSRTAAPGTAPFLTATALVTMLKSQAVTQKMIAAYLRQTGAQLAHQTAAQKTEIQAAIDLHQAIRHTAAR